jgi:hypothetical protein
MSLFWIIYIIAACVVAGIIALLIRHDIKRGKVVTVTLLELLLCAAFMFAPVFNVVMAFVLTWFYLDECGGHYIFTFGNKQGPK